MPLREYIQKNFWWKLASVACATLIWFTINSSIQGTIKSSEHRVITGSTLTFSLPITVMMTASDGRGFVVTPREVEVTVRGSAAVLDRLKKTDVQVFVSLVDVKDARGLRKKVLVHTPDAVALVKVVPEEVSVDKAAASPANQTRE